MMTLRAFYFLIRTNRNNILFISDKEMLFMHYLKLI